VRYPSYDYWKRSRHQGKPVLNAEPEAQYRVIKTMHEQWRCKYTQDEDKENTSRMNIITLGKK